MSVISALVSDRLLKNCCQEWRYVSAIPGLRGWGRSVWISSSYQVWSQAELNKILFQKQRRDCLAHHSGSSKSKHCAVVGGGVWPCSDLSKQGSEEEADIGTQSLWWCAALLMHLNPAFRLMYIKVWWRNWRESLTTVRSPRKTMLCGPLLTE